MKLTKWAMLCFFAACGSIMLAMILFVKIKFVNTTSRQLELKKPILISSQLRSILKELGLDYQYHDEINQFEAISNLHPSQFSIFLALLEIDKRQMRNKFVNGREEEEGLSRERGARSSSNLPLRNDGNRRQTRARDEAMQALESVEASETLTGPPGSRRSRVSDEMMPDRTGLTQIAPPSLVRYRSNQEAAGDHTLSVGSKQSMKFNGDTEQSITYLKRTNFKMRLLSDYERATVTDREVVILNDYGRPGLTSRGEVSLHISQNPDIDTRGKWQMQQMDKFCHKYSDREDHSKTFTLPPTTDELHRRSLFRHLLFDDERKLLFCFIPKVGCTNMRRFLFVIQGLLPLESIYWEHVPEIQLREGILIASFLNSTLSDEERLEKITNYWKFMIVRNPLERLLSAYLNKLSKPLNTSLNHHDHFEMDKLSILLQYKTELLREWLSNTTHNQNKPPSRQISKFNPLTVDFETYIQWIVDTPNDRLNEHYAPMITIAQPCRIRYNFYGNFKMYSSEVECISHRLHVPLEYFQNKAYHWKTSTSELLPLFYSQVNWKLKRELFYDFYKELEFYYTLYPEERHSHFELLGVRKDVLS